MCSDSREVNQECLRQIAQMRRAQIAHGAESHWAAPLGEAARSLAALPVPPPLPDLNEPELCLDSAVFPQMSRRPSAVNSKSRAWGWICEQLCVDASRPGWLHRPPAGHPGSIFADLFHRIGDCLAASAQRRRPKSSRVGITSRICEWGNVNGSLNLTTQR